VLKNQNRSSVIAFLAMFRQIEAIVSTSSETRKSTMGLSWFALLRADRVGQSLAHAVI
jgi:hypothetical protein